MKPLPLPEYETVVSLLDYDPDTGIFIWKVSKGGQKAGNRAGQQDPDGYRKIRINGQRCGENRLAWLIMTKTQPPLDMRVDHENHVKNDNRFQNLRLMTVGDNTVHGGAEKVEPKCYQITRVGTFQAVYTMNRKRYTCGTFKTAEEASKVGRAARQAARSK